ncbi:MAG: helix-turn-helix domain-containing protein [Desulfurococcaceae archaeon]
MVSAIVVLGFDITHAVTTLVNFKPREVSVITASIDGGLDHRSLVAYNSFEQTAMALGVKCDRVVVEVLKFSNAIDVIRSIMIRYVSSESNVILDLGGGLRMLIVEALTALLSLPQSLRRYFKVLLYIEGQNKYIELSSDDIISELTKGKEIFWSKLNYLERVILEKMEYNTPYRLNQIHEIIKQTGESITKQNLVRILNKLIKKDYIERIRKGVYRRRVITLPQSKI